MPMGQNNPGVQYLKHFIDLTGESDDETSHASKKRKPSEIPESQWTQVPSANRYLSTTQPATPIRQTKEAVNSTKAATDSDGNVHVKKSPFKNRPSWSRVRSTTTTPQNGSEASGEQSKQPNGSLSHPRSTSHNALAITSPLHERQQNSKPRTAVRQEKHTSRPAATSSSAALPNNATSHDSPRRSRSRHDSSASEEVRLHTSIFESMPSTQRAPSLTPLPDRSRDRTTASPTQSRNILPPACTATSQISVVIDNSQRTPTQSTTANELLDRFIQPLPGTSPRLSERAPVTKKPVTSPDYRRQLLFELEKDTSVIYSRASSVEAVFGRHGFSPMYSTDGNKAIRKQLVQPKAKKVSRKEVKLDWSLSDTLAQEPFEPEKLVPPKDQAYEILRGRFDETMEPPITFVNDINTKQLSGKFQFISSYIRRPGVEASPPDATNYGCSCVGSCKSSSCGCLVDDTEVDDFGDEIDHGKIVPYQRVHTATGKTMSVLRDDYIKKSYEEEEKSEIIECNRNCECGADCWNRVVQKGRTVPLEIFMTAKCGFGLRSPENIIKGQFIDIYLGEIITETELESRELAMEGAPSYIFSLDWFHAKDVYYVDSLNFGTPSRFMNHSCNPNCRVFTVILNRADEKVYFLAFFAIRDIPAGTELNIDYNPQEAGKTYPKPKPGDDDDVVLCHCGEPNCRVRLWPGPKMKKGKGWARG